MDKSIAKKTEMIRLIPLMFFGSVIFLLVHIREYRMPLSRFPFLAETDETMMYDSFSYVKAVAVIITAVVSLTILALLLLYGYRKIKKSFLYIPMAVYAAAVILSYAFSGYREFALMGTYQRFEGTIVHLCYIFMAFYAVNVIDTKIDIDHIIDSLFAGVTVANLIGLSQLAGHDFFSTTAGRRILLGSMAGGELTFNFGKHEVYQTVYNPNYVLFYMCLVFPVLINSLIETVNDLKEKKRGSDKNRCIARAVWLCVLAVMMVANAVGAGSVGSVFGLAFGILIVLFVRFFPAHPLKVVAILSAVFIAAFFVIIFGGVKKDYSVFYDERSRMENSEENMSKNASESDREGITKRPDIAWIRTYDNTIGFMINGNLLKISYDPETAEFSAKDANDTAISTFTNPEDKLRLEFDDNRFCGIISVTPLLYKGKTFAVFTTVDEQWRFEFTKDGAKYLNYINNHEDLSEVEHAGFIKNYGFGSGRGYIWDTTLPVIKQRPIFGSGADTFGFVFPQNDYAVRYSHNLQTYCVYDKPHDLYLQIAVSFGLVGLAAFLMTALSAFGFAFKKFKRDGADFTAVSVMAGIAAFLLAGAANDSSVSVMPMFYMMLGCLMAYSLFEYGKTQTLKIKNEKIHETGGVQNA